jgi:GNAT superfamily N-acetyltransferase
MPGKGKSLDLEFHPLDDGRWKDLTALFGKRGACGGCWCMWWRQSAKEYEASKGAGNRRKMRNLVRKGANPGIIAYHDGEPVGWCSVAPREEYPRLSRSRILKPVDDRPVWSIVCLFVAKEFRGMGVSSALIGAAVDFVRKHGGKTVEAYPVEPKKDRMPDAFAFHGLAVSYSRAGFREVARRSETRPVMRYEIRT